VPAALTKATADVATNCLVHTRSVVSGQKLSPAKSDTAAGRTEYADFGGLASGVLQLTGQSAVPKVAIPPHALTADINANNVQKDAAVVNAINEFVTASVNGFKVDGDPASARPALRHYPHACSACWSPSGRAGIVLAFTALDAPPKADFTFIRGDVSTLDPAIISWQQDNRVARIVSEGLTRSNNLAHNFEPTPATAASWDVSDDKRTITFHIRKDAAWSNGGTPHRPRLRLLLAPLHDARPRGHYMKLYEFIEGGKQFIAWRRGTQRLPETHRLPPPTPPAPAPQTSSGRRRSPSSTNLSSARPLATTRSVSPSSAPRPTSWTSQPSRRCARLPTPRARPRIH
jgi:hypothetical protein